MFILNISNPMTLFLLILAIALLIFLGQEEKKSITVAIPLISFLILVIHVVQVVTLSTEYAYLASTLYKSIALDFLFILITFFAYLWVDDIEAKTNNIKSIDNSLDWFWKEV